MSKKRKLHQLNATITNAYLGISKSRQYKNQPFYCLDIIQSTLLGKRKATIYAFYNLTPPSFWNVLEQRTFQNKQYLFYCEKRTRGWRLKEWEEIN